MSVLVGHALAHAILTDLWLTGGSVSSESVQRRGSKGAYILIGSAVGWFAMLCLDTTIFALTVIKSVQIRHSIHNGLLQVLIRDGAF